MKAIWNGKVVADSNETIVIEGNHYFPKQSLQLEFFKASETHTRCAWKGEAWYYTINVGGIENKDAAWYYPQISEKAKAIEGYVAFWKGVKITE
ncbi:MAG TPA: DUF427 domain-containing protein [Cytophagaceae bacterium]|jgi:uncharacterized protein (DUF427 family)